MAELLGTHGGRAEAASRAAAPTGALSCTISDEKDSGPRNWAEKISNFRSETRRKMHQNAHAASCWRITELLGTHDGRVEAADRAAAPTGVLSCTMGTGQKKFRPLKKCPPCERIADFEPFFFKGFN